MSEKNHEKMMGALNAVRDQGVLTDWEESFLESLNRWEGELTERQAKTLKKIHAERVGVEELFRDEDPDNG